MKVLQLFSDWKWTGLAEPVLSLCESLTAEGVDVTIAYRKTPIDFPERTVEKEVKQRRLKSYEGFKLNRYFARETGFDMLELRHMCHKNTLILSMLFFPDHFTALSSLGTRKAIDHRNRS